MSNLVDAAVNEMKMDNIHDNSYTDRLLRHWGYQKAGKKHDDDRDRYVHHQGHEVMINKKGDWHWIPSASDKKGKGNSNLADHLRRMHRPE